jgi:hypothetical protein
VLNRETTQPHPILCVCGFNNRKSLGTPLHESCKFLCLLTLQTGSSSRDDDDDDNYVKESGDEDKLSSHTHTDFLTVLMVALIKSI